ncbi:hypothetical protein ABS648_09280 [Pseudomonas solani]|uniref:Uncharacterized protein n=1 Tax=Pseudomonas solani TaxID=2731552 RepID=A0AAU7Y891_9PSED
MKYFWLFLCFFLGFYSLSESKSGRLFLFSGAPAKHDSMIMTGSAVIPIEYNELEPVLSDSPAAETASQVRYVYKVDPSKIPSTATHVLVLVKMKAYIPIDAGSGGMNYAQIFARVPDNNHFIHCEAWGGGVDWQEERRRVTFSSVYLPIVNGEVTVDVGREIRLRGTVEFAVYMEGYLDGKYGALDTMKAIFNDLRSMASGLYSRLLDRGAGLFS